jgi:ABC-type sugar transport system permease subunit
MAHDAGVSERTAAVHEPFVAARPAATGSSARAGWASRLRHDERLLFVLFVAPNLILFGLFTYWPMLQNVRLSTVRWDMISPVRTPVGLDNYRYLAADPVFQRVVLNTLVFAVAAVGLSLLLGLATALLLNRKLRWRDGARAVLFAPTLLSGAAIGIVWVYVFDPRYGLVAQVLGWVGLQSPAWLDDPAWAMPAIVIVYVWKNLGFATVIFLAGLQAIPQDLYEAARIDGAGAWWRFRSVTLPMLSPITFFLLITSILATFQSFDIVQVMTEGGPVNATNTLVYYVYEQGFVAFNAGRAAAAAMVLFAVMLGVTLLQLRVGEGRVHYG